MTKSLENLTKRYIEVCTRYFAEKKWINLCASVDGIICGRSDFLSLDKIGSLEMAENDTQKRTEVLSVVKKKFLASLKQDWGEKKFNDVFVAVCSELNKIRLNHNYLPDDEFRKIVIEQYTEKYKTFAQPEILIALTDIALDTILIE